MSESVPGQADFIQTDDLLLSPPALRGLVRSQASRASDGLWGGWRSDLNLTRGKWGWGQALRSLLAPAEPPPLPEIRWLVCPRAQVPPWPRLLSLVGLRTAPAPRASPASDSQGAGAQGQPRFSCWFTSSDPVLSAPARLSPCLVGVTDISCGLNTCHTLLLSPPPTTQAMAWTFVFAQA